MRTQLGTASGVIGVTWHKRDRLWRARIVHNQREILLGYFKKREDAVAARQAAEAVYFTHSPVCEQPA